MATNQIRGVSIRPVAPDADGEAGHALVIALEVPDSTRLVGFLEDVVTRFKVERMAAPPDTAFMLITVIGDVPVAEFAGAWQATIANDAPARALLGMMRQADVMQGDASGQMTAVASLLAPASEQS